MIFIKRKNSKKLEIKYNINSGIPFKWEYEILDNDIVEFINKKTVGEKTKEPICGGSLTIYYYFKGIKKGNTVMKFRLINFADNYIEREEEYNISVDKNLNLKII